MIFNEEKVGFFPMPPSRDWVMAQKGLDKREKQELFGTVQERTPGKKTKWRKNLFGSEIFLQDLDAPCTKRGKNVNVHAPGPFWVRGGTPSSMTRIEVSAGVLFGARIGFNPGELVDFLAGIVGLDLYKDDVD
jgi:hypothetical protein